MCSSNILVKNKWISEFHRTNPQESKCWSTFYINYFLRCYLMMHHQPIVKRVNGTHEWAHRPYQPLSAPYHCCLYKHRLLDERHDRCPFVLRHSISQVTSFMQLGMLWSRLLEMVGKEIMLFNDQSYFITICRWFSTLPVNWPAQRAIDAENVYIWLRHLGFIALYAFLTVTPCVGRFVDAE